MSLSDVSMHKPRGQEHPGTLNVVTARFMLLGDSIILTHSDTCDTDAQVYTQDKPLLLQGAKVQNISKTIGSAHSLFGAAEHHRNGTARRGIWHLEVGNLNTYDQTRI